jgi:DNA-binding NtrC family response regulator
MSPSVVIYEPDLLFSSRIESICSRSGLDAQVTVTLSGLDEAVRRSVPKLLLVDLDALGEPCTGLVESIRGRCRLVGYYSHADSELATKALAFGFTDVFPRRIFAEKLMGILHEFSSG